MKEKKTLQQKLLQRKYKIPNSLVYWGYHTIGSLFVIPKYRYTLTVKDSLSDCDGPCFLIWNHLSRLDHFFLMKAAYPRKISILAGYNEFFRSHLHTVFRMMNIIPKKIFTQDFAGLRGMNSIISQGGCVCFSPEGMSSLYGTNQPIVPGTGKFLQHYNIPVYFLKLKGSYLTSTKICLDERYGRVEGELSLLFSPEQLQSLSPQEIDGKINEAFRHDDYAWSFEQNLTWKNRGHMCSQLDSLLYRCPKCGTELQMQVSKDADTFRCAACGNGASVDSQYRFVPLNSDCVLPASPADWVTEQRKLVIREIRENPSYAFSDRVKLGDLPKYRYLRRKATSEPCGEGELTVDHAGIHYRGTRRGEPWSFDLSYAVVFSLVIVTDTTHFGLFVDGDYYEFYPEHSTTGKFLLLTEEMHRLHVNLWKNFPWNSGLYPENGES